LASLATYLFGQRKEGRTVATEHFEELVEDFRISDDWKDPLSFT